MLTVCICLLPVGTNPPLNEKRRSYVENELKMLDEEKEDSSSSSDDRSEAQSSASSSSSMSSVMPKVFQQFAARTHEIASGFFKSESDDTATKAKPNDHRNHRESGHLDDEDGEDAAAAATQQELDEWMPKREAFMAEAEAHKRSGDLKSALAPLSANIERSGRCVTAADYEARYVRFIGLCVLVPC